MTVEDEEIEEMMRGVFEDLGLEGATDSEIEDLIAIHGRALGGCALEFQRELDKEDKRADIPKLASVLEQIRTRSFESPVSGKALIIELTENVSPESLQYLVVASHLAIRAAGARAAEKKISLIDALDDIVLTIGQKATNTWNPDDGGSQEEWCHCLFDAAQSTAEMATGEAFFRLED